VGDLSDEARPPLTKKPLSNKKKEIIRKLLSEEIKILLKNEEKESWTLHFTDRMF
jgi:hypothetical protein